MHALKVLFLLALTLGTMRAASWAPAYVLMRWTHLSVPRAHVLANAACLIVFLAWLHWTRLPGEFMDYSAAIFGLVVYAVFTLIDLWWRPWALRHGAKPLEPSANHAGSPNQSVDRSGAPPAGSNES